MASSRSLIIGGGIGSVGSLLAGALLTVAVVDPPQVQIASRLTVPAAAARSTHIVMSDGVTVSGTTTLTNGLLIAGNGSEYQSNGGVATTTRAVVIGNGAIARGTGGAMLSIVLIGGNATAINAIGMTGAVVIGEAASYTGIGGAVTIGAGAVNTAQNSVAIGHNISLNATSSNSVGIGQNVAITGLRCTAIGDAVVATGNDLIVLGQGSSIAGGALRSVAISGTNNAFNDTFTVLGTAFANGTILFGNINSVFTTVLIGNGNTAVSPATVTYRNSNSVGTDIQAGDIIMQPGISTGNAIAGKFAIATGDRVAGSGVAAQAISNKFTVDSNVTETFVTIYGLGTRDARLIFSIAGTTQALVGVAGQANGGVNGAVANEMVIRSQTQRLLITTDSGATIASSFTAAGVQTWEKDRGVRFNNQTSSAAAAAGTLGNAPTAGNPGFWLKINIGGTNYAIPCWLG